MQIFEYPFAPQRVLPFLPSFRAGILNYCIGSKIISIKKIIQKDQGGIKNLLEVLGSLLIAFDNGIELLFFSSDTVNSILIHRQTSTSYYYSFNGFIDKDISLYPIYDGYQDFRYLDKKIKDIHVCNLLSHPNARILKSPSQCAVKIEFEDGEFFLLGHSLNGSAYLQILLPGNSPQYELNYFPVEQILQEKIYKSNEDVINAIPVSSSKNFNDGIPIKLPFYNLQHIRSRNFFWGDGEKPSLSLSAKKYLQNLKLQMMEKNFSIIDMGFEIDQQGDVSINKPIEIFSGKSTENQELNFALLDYLLK